MYNQLTKRGILKQKQKLQERNLKKKFTGKKTKNHLYYMDRGLLTLVLIERNKNEQVKNEILHVKNNHQYGLPVIRDNLTS